MSGWKSFSLGTTEEEEVLVPGTASSVLVETLLSLCKLIDSVTSITTEVKYGFFWSYIEFFRLSLKEYCYCNSVSGNHSLLSAND